MFAYDHAECIGTAESLIKAESNMSKELTGGIGVAYRQVDEDL
jgi:hypothetical protein